MAKKDEPTEIVHPVGVFVGVDVEECMIGETVYAVDPETGKVTGPK